VSAAVAPIARRDVDTVMLDGATVIHRAGHVHTLDPVATLVWQCLDGRATVDEIAADLAPAFAVPVDRARRDVADVVGELDRLGLLVPAAPGAAAPVPPTYLEDPPGSCASCADREWATITTLRIGARLVTVGGDAGMAAAVEAVLGAHVVADAPDRPGPPFVGISAPPPVADTGPRPLHLLHRGDAVIARARTAPGIVRALAAYLATWADLAPSGLAPLDALVVGTADQVVLVPVPDDPIRFRHALARLGVRASDVPVTVIDPSRREVVLGAPGLTVAGGLDHGDDTPVPLPWGRYAIAALGVPGVPTPSRALLTFAPARGDHRDPEATLGALVALVAGLPIVDASEPDAVAALVGRPARGPE
jgi:hypothetical protein